MHIAVFTVQVSVVGQVTKNVLFIGNSYTGYNNMAAMVSTCATSAGDAINFDTHTPGGSTFLQHSSNSAVQEKIAQGNWDFVVLQEQSQLPSFPEAQVATQVYPYATQLDSTIRYHNPCAETIFYMTWGRKNGDASNCPTWPPVCTYEGMDSLLHLRYKLMAEMNEAIVAPVGAVWNYIRQNHPEIELFNADESHPSLAGSYVAACCFYTTIFRKNPQAITWNSSFSPQIANDIREAVRVVVFEQLENWFIGSYDPLAEFEINSINTPEYFFENTSINSTTFEWYVNDELVGVASNLSYTFQSSGEYEVSLISSHCGQSSTYSECVFFDEQTGTDEQHIQIDVYPNPITSSLNVELNQPTAFVLLDCLGRVILVGTMTEGQQIIDFSQFQTGVYFLQLASGAIIKLMKNS